MENYDSLKKAALISLEAGRLDDAYYACAVAIKRPEAKNDSLLKRLFAQLKPHRHIKSYNPDLQMIILKCLEEEGIEYQKIFPAWKTLLLLDPKFEIFAKAFAGEDTDLQKDFNALEPLLLDPYLIYGLRRFLFDDPLFEKINRNLRKAVLLEFWPSDRLKTKHMPLLGGLAELNYAHEYVFPPSDEELKLLDTVKLDDPVSVLIYAAYKPMPRDISKNLSAVPAFKSAYKLQVQDVVEREKLKDDITTLIPLKDQTSLDVSSMYEENPYPRWRYLPLPVSYYPDIQMNALVAGSGTGKFANYFAKSFPNSKIIGIDITKSSIAYATQKKNEHNNDNLTFYQCDILEVDKTGNTYDFINSSGVIHHMKDPVLAWTKLRDVLKKGGILALGLYSTKARQAQKRLRDYAFEKKFSTDPEGIIAFREDILKNFQGPDIQMVSKWQDFYSVSEMRDLFFHVQEKTYTLPELTQIMADLDMELVKFFSVTEPYQSIYFEKYSKRADDMDAWARLEEDYPQTFMNMYNFICKRKSEILNPNAEKLLTTFS